jgi:hypothetical protein
VSARVPLESCAVGSRVRIVHGRGDVVGLVVAADEDGSVGIVDDEQQVYRFTDGWLAEVIDAPAPQQPRGEEVDPRDAVRMMDGTEGRMQRAYPPYIHTCTDGIARVVCDRCTPNPSGRVAGHAEQCGCHGCVTGPLEREVARLKEALGRFGSDLVVAKTDRDEWRRAAEALAIQADALTESLRTVRAMLVYRADGAAAIAEAERAIEAARTGDYRDALKEAKQP